jgi:hypothetical protein
MEEALVDAPEDISGLAGRLVAWISGPRVFCSHCGYSYVGATTRTPITELRPRGWPLL